MIGVRETDHGYFKGFFHSCTNVRGSVNGDAFIDYHILSIGVSYISICLKQKRIVLMVHVFLYFYTITCTSQFQAAHF